MGYAITGGIGLLVGIGLLIWALRERTKRHEAEREADAARAALEKAAEQADKNALAALKAEDFAKRLDDQILVLRGRLNEARVRLGQCGDPKAVKDWLDAELEAEEL